MRTPPRAVLAVIAAAAVAVVIALIVTRGDDAKRKRSPGQSWVEIRSDSPRAEIAKQAAFAIDLGMTPCVYFHAAWCQPCAAIARYRHDPPMLDAFEGVQVLAVDVTDGPIEQLEAVGLHAGVVPAFYIVDGNGRPTGRRLDGGAWGEDIPANMAPVLAAFFAR